MQADQVYVTHCLYNEGLSRDAGIGVRASSTRDPLLLRFALEYPAYEPAAGVPVAPRRLARVRVPGGRWALIHSVPRTSSDHGRTNSFLSHVIFTDALSPEDGLAAWGAPGWASDCGPQTPKELPAMEALPRGQIVGDRMLTAFLQTQAAEPDQDSSASTCPERLQGDRDRRRRLLALTLRGCLLVLEAGPAAPRGRFFILGEPGLVALLLYGAARLLPQGLAESLTFSTYENALTTLRAFHHAQVVGTWLADPARGLDEEFFTERGYALDTFSDRHSDELGRDADSALEEWIELAARGEWQSIDRLHGLLGGTSSVVAYKDGVRAARLTRRITSGDASVEELLALKQSPWGDAILVQRADEVWPLVRQACLQDARLCVAFADMIRARLPELERRAALTLRSTPPGDWQCYFRVFWSVLQQTPGELRDVLERMLPEPPLPTALCFALLSELQSLGVTATDARVSLHALLKNLGEQELDRFARSNLPREWFVWALCYALVRAQTRDAAARHLHEGGGDLVRVFWQQFKLLRDESQRRTILSALVATAGDGALVFLAGLLASSYALKPETLVWLLEALGAWDPDWVEFWGRDDHLGRLLERVRDFGEDGGPIWDRFCGAIDRGVLPPGDPYQHTLLMNLVAVRGRPGRPLPQPADEAIADWALLRDHFEKAAATRPEARAAVIHACNRRRLDPMTELSAYFARFIEPQSVREELLADFAGFFRSFFPEPVEYPDHEALLVSWLQVVDGCQDPLRKEAYQSYYLDHCVPEDFRRRLAEETHRAGKLLSAVYETVQKGLLKRPLAPSDSSTAHDMLHQLAGVRVPDGETALRLAAFWKRLPWLVCALAGGVLAVLVFGLYRPPTGKSVLPAFVPFLPLVVALADGIALQSAGLAALRARRQLPEPARAVMSEFLSVLLVGLVCGLATGGIVLAWGQALRPALALGAAVLGSATATAILATVGSWARVKTLAMGPVVRAAAGVLALLVFVLLARVLGV
jgi:hypothetical protein